MIDVNIRYRILEDKQVFVNLNDLLRFVQDGQTEAEGDGLFVLEQVEGVFLRLGIQALLTETHTTLDRTEDSPAKLATQAKRGRQNAY